MKSIFFFLLLCGPLLLPAQQTGADFPTEDDFKTGAYAEKLLRWSAETPPQEGRPITVIHQHYSYVDFPQEDDFKTDTYYDRIDQLVRLLESGELSYAQLPTPLHRHMCKYWPTVSGDTLHVDRPIDHSGVITVIRH